MSSKWAHEAKEVLRHGWKQGVCDIDRHGKHIPGTRLMNHATFDDPHDDYELQREQ